MKICSICNEQKKLSLFGLYKNGCPKNYCKQCHSNRMKIRYKENRERLLSHQKKLNKQNLEKYRATRVSSQATRRARQRNATPSWLSKEQRLQILDLYKLRDCFMQNGLQYHVDHIVPLFGENVCGLHVPWNLQLLSPEDNLLKSNKI